MPPFTINDPYARNLGYYLLAPTACVAQRTENMNMWTWMDIKLSVSKKKTSLFPLESPPPPKSGPHLGLVRGGHFSHSQSQGRQHWPRSTMDLGFICLSLLGPSEVRTLCWSPSSPHHALRFTASFPHPPALLFTQGTFTGPFVGVKQ